MYIIPVKKISDKILQCEFEKNYFFYLSAYSRTVHFIPHKYPNLIYVCGVLFNEILFLYIVINVMILNPSGKLSSDNSKNIKSTEIV